MGRSPWRSRYPDTARGGTLGIGELTVGHARQHLDLLGYALIVNSVALHRYARRRPPDAFAA